jgi:NET1-associated nuclear protein 1 (U3 small nucleolar RNA-associated protein 17)
MGGSIDFITISHNNQFYCVGLDDNSICLVNSIIQTIEQVIQGLQYGNYSFCILA